MPTMPTHAVLGSDLWKLWQKVRKSRFNRRDVASAQVHVLDAGHFALDTAADEIAALVSGFAGPSQ